MGHLDARFSPVAERLLEMLGRAPGGYRREGTAALATCPRCGKPKLHFRLVDPPRADYPCRFSCFSGCCTTARWDGRPEFALAELLGVSVGAAKAELYGRVLRGGGALPGLELDADLDAPGDEEQPMPTLEWPGTYLPICSPAAARGRAYLEGRGIPVEAASRYGARYAPPHRSVAFPVEDAGRLVGWQERLVVPHEWVDAEGRARTSAKACTSTDFRREVWMFEGRLAGSEHAFPLEGPVDAVKADLCGGNVASLGKELTPALIRRLASFPWRRLYCGLDEGTAAETVRLVREFDQAVRHPGRECYWVRWPKGRDAGSLTFAEVYDCWRRAERVTASSVVFDMGLA